MSWQLQCSPVPRDSPQRSKDGEKVVERGAGQQRPLETLGSIPVGSRVQGPVDKKRLAMISIHLAPPQPRFVDGSRLASRVPYIVILIPVPDTRTTAKGTEAQRY